MKKVVYWVEATFDPCPFDNLEDALKYAEMVSMSGEPYIDEDIKVVKVETEETTMKTFRNGGIVG